MPYTMMIYLDEKIKVPEVGQKFVVIRVSKATDIHWGKGTHIELKLEKDIDAITKQTKIR